MKYQQMELFLPGLLVLVIVALFAFLIIPRTGPMILAVISLIALIAAGVHHYKLFSSEYALSTWQYGLASYAPWITLGLALLFIIGAISFIFAAPETKSKVLNSVSTPMQQIQAAVQESVQAMPPATTATNAVTGAFNRGIAAITQPEGAPAAAPSSSNQNRRPNQGQSPLVPGVGFPASQF
jgi:hypothetical protein